MAKNKLPKNKQDLSPKSGPKKKSPVKKTVIKFLFKGEDGTLYRNGTGRLKVDKEGFLSFIQLLPDNKWKPIKARLLSLKVTEVSKVINPVKKRA